jgi:hypothetical protein
VKKRGEQFLSDNPAKAMQLPMFMRAHDLMGSLTGTLDFSYDEPEDVLDRKLVRSKKPVGEGHGAGVHASVEREGVINPVQLIHAESGGLMMGQGHHRIAAAAEISRRTGRDMWLPVVHTDARESTDNPISIYSDVYEKKQAIADYRQWSHTTPAIGQDVGWMQREQDAAEGVKEQVMARVNARPRPKHTGATGQM